MICSYCSPNNTSPVRYFAPEAAFEVWELLGPAIAGVLMWP